jgi:hypothetical protein
MLQKTLLVPIALLINAPLSAHVVGADTTEPLSWHSEQIRRVVSLGYPQGSTEKIEGKDCMSGSLLSIDVSDDYAYDIDETVQVDVEFDLKGSDAEVELAYDKSTDSPGVQKIKLPGRHDRWYKHTFTLQRARFAGGPLGVFLPIYYNDFSIGASPAESGGESKVTVCNIELKRSYTTPQPKYGSLELKTLDQDGKPVPARVGIYDATGRMPVPASEAVPLKSEHDLVNTIALREGSASWPVKNRQIFYIDGCYHARLPVGSYDIVAVRGLEYRIARRSVVIEANKETVAAMRLQRWTHMAAQGWYSGDTHMHYSRSNVRDDYSIRLLMQGEDLNVANLLQPGSSGAVYWRQYKWGEHGRYGAVPYTLVAGEENPRTLHLGHTVELNLKEEAHEGPEHYYLYHRTFENVHRQGGVTGFAHAAGPRNFAPKGMALDVPYGLVDLVEVLQMGSLGVERWFDFLNLGYKLTPSAGSDAPYLDHHPGSVRNYVYVGSDYSVQKWFDQLKAGHTFVTNGPMLQLTVNGSPMGSEIRIKPGDMLTITAVATLNPDIDRLRKLELLEQGDLVAAADSDKGAGRLELVHRVKATHGTWFVLRASGGNGRTQTEGSSVAAVSAPVYVDVEGSGFCKPTAVAAIVADLKGQLQQIVAVDVAKEFEMEPWVTQEPRTKYWPSQKALLQERINATDKIYDDILRRAGRQECIAEGK